MNFMSDMLKILAFASIAGIFTAICINFIKIIFGKRLSPMFHWLVWGIFILRLILPNAPESAFSIYNVYNLFTQNQNNKPEKVTNEFDLSEQSQFSIPENLIGEANHDNYIAPQNSNANLSEVQNFKLNLNNILIIIYLIGVLTIASLYIIRYTKFKAKIKYLKFSKPEDYKILNYVKTSLNINLDIKLYTGDNKILNESFLAGVFKPVIILKDNLSESEKSAVLTHELLHCKYLDNLTNIVFAVIKIVYWFNPFVGYFLNKARDDMELLRDIQTINLLNYRKEEYAMMLFNSSKQNINKNLSIAGASAMSASGKQLIYRLNFIAKFKKPQVLASILAGALCVILSGCALTNPLSASAKNTDETVIINASYTELTAVPSIIEKSIFEQNITDYKTKLVESGEIEQLLTRLNYKYGYNRPYDKMNAYYRLVDLNDMSLTEEQRAETLASYPFLEDANYAAYVFDPLANERETTEILGLMQNFTQLTDGIIAEMNVKYGLKDNVHEAKQYEVLNETENIEATQVTETVQSIEETTAVYYDNNAVISETDETLNETENPELVSGENENDGYYYQRSLIDDNSNIITFTKQGELTKLPLLIERGTLDVAVALMTMSDGQIMAADLNEEYRAAVRKISAYYKLIEWIGAASGSLLTHTQSIEMLEKYPFAKSYSAYVFDPNANERERESILEILNNYTSLTDEDVLAMCAEFDIPRNEVFGE